MSAIFISHSSKDNAWAERIATWLREQGYEGIFLDFDPKVGIPTGRDWEKELYHQLRRCRAVIALCSKHFNRSQWCISEVAIASNLGKSLFPVQIAPCTAPSLLRKVQITRFTEDPEEGFRCLARGLAEAGLDPKDIFQWDQKRPPYPGLMSFQERDAPVFFGRGEAIREGLDRLHNLRRYGGKALLLVLGASGCGKSSLVRAGVVPRLRRDPESWLVLDPFRPRLDPFAELAKALTNAFSAKGSPAPEAPATAVDLQRQLEDLRRASGQREATVVISIDQFEELLGDGGDSAAEQGIGGDPFLAFLREAMQDPSGRLVVLATLRSDFLGTFQCHQKLLGLLFDDLKLGPMEVEGYTQVIEGPAEVAGLRLEPGLSQRLVADTQTGDALPLLAFTLRELWERYGRDGDLTLTEYGSLGGLEGSVQRTADGVFQARTLSHEQTQAVRQAFLAMSRINEQGLYARIPARWEDMQPEAREVLDRFVKARLLIRGKENGTIEVAHEALLRTWPTLKDWLDQSRQELEQQSRVRRLCQDLNIAWASEPIRREAFSSLESMAKVDPQALQLAEETLVEVLADGQRLPWEWLVAARLLETIGSEQTEAALRGLLEREQLHQESDQERVAIVLEVLTKAASSLKQIYWLRRATSTNGSRSLLVPTATVSADSQAISTSLVTLQLFPSPREEGQSAWFEELAPGVPLTMVGIPAESFPKGSFPDEPERSVSEGPQQKVSLGAFFLAQTPITQAQWQVVADWQKVERDLKPDPSHFKGANRPVEQVNWLDAVEFCRRLSQRTGKRYGLPSGAQWEYACRAGSTTPFSFGKTITPELANYYGDGPYGTYRKETTEVASFPANAWGLHDLHGNVWEWCDDHWHDNYKDAPKDWSDWLYPKAANNEERLLRGGSWYTLPRYCRSAFRHLDGLDYANNYVGFRVVCLPQGPSLNP